MSPLSIIRHAITRPADMRVRTSRRRALAIVVLTCSTLTACTKLDDLSAPSCAFDVSPASASFGNSNATGLATVTTSTSCAWTATANASWVAITNISTAAGPGTVTYILIPNPTPQVRISTLSIAGKTVTVIQDSVNSQCSYVVSPTSASFTAPGGSGSVNISANTGCGWTATSGASWITIASDTSGAGSATVRYNVANNSATAARSAALIVAGQTVSITQAGR